MKYAITLTILLLGFYACLHAFPVQSIEPKEIREECFLVNSLTNNHALNFTVKYNDERLIENTSRTVNGILQPILVRWKTSLNTNVCEIQLKARVLCRTFKILTNDKSGILFAWQSNYNLPSSFKIVFSIYDSYLSTKIPDPRIFILSSRAHPPTI